MTSRALDAEPPSAHTLESSELLPAAAATHASAHHAVSNPDTAIAPLQRPSLVVAHVRHRPSTSPMLHGHTSHAMILQLQEYRERVQSACGSTYQFPLQPPSTPDEQRRRRSKGYCRARVLATTKQFFPAREPAPSHFSSPVGHGKERVLPRSGDRGHVKFHQMQPRKDEFLFGDAGGGSGTARRAKIAHDSGATGIAKDHFALGPGQYDVVSARPKTRESGGAAVKFSPSDRFHETFTADQLGPGQYLPSDALTTPRAAAAVFSQIPRCTEVALLASPTASAVSSYYYVPASGFLDKNAPQNDRPSWQRAPRLTSKRHTTATAAAAAAAMKHSVTDFVTKNCTDLDKQNAVLRLRRARKLQGRLPVRASGNASSDDNADDDSFCAPVTLFKRRSSIFLDVRAASALASPVRKSSGVSSMQSTAASSAATAAGDAMSKSECALRGLVTLTSIATFSVRLSRIYHVTAVLRRVARAKQQHVQRVVFTEWKRLDYTHSLQYARHLIVCNSFRLRLRLRIARKTAHVAVLRQFLGGLSIDVQFAVAMKKIKRKVQLIQRWWRHVQLMVRAREEALYHKWVLVESRLRLEYISQMPHLQRIFQPPPAPSSLSSMAAMAALSTSAASAGTESSLAPVAHGKSHSGHENGTTLPKLLNLPEQKKWFTAHFVLSSDGGLRGYSDTKELVVEVKHYRCHFHDCAAGRSESDLAPGLGLGGNGSDLALQAYQSYSSASWKPFMMVFRQGAFRFVLLTSASPLPTEILAWKDKLERLVAVPMTASGGSGSVSAAAGSDTAHHHSHSQRQSVGEFVEVSMQSDILASHHGHHLAHHGSTSNSHSANSLTASGGGSFLLAAGVSGSPLSLVTSTSGATPSAFAAARSPTQHGKLQARVRSIRQRNRAGLTVTEGELLYYVVDLLKDVPKVPTAVIWQVIREKLREKRKSFRAELYRYNVEMFHYHCHQEQTKHIHVLDKFKEFFTLERPRRPHFRSLISNRKMEVIIRQTIEQLRVAAPSNPRFLLDAPKATSSPSTSS